MEWVKRLHGRIVGLDTAPLIYFVEENPVYLSLIDPFFEALEHGDLEVVTSTLTLTEVLVYPYKKGDWNLARQFFRILMHSRNVKALPVTQEIASKAALLRAEFGLKTPDAIQLATAFAGNASTFLTNDDDLIPVSGIAVIHLDRLLRQ
jgi:predicted nucleic acid-binding protein